MLEEVLRISLPTTVQIPAIELVDESPVSDEYLVRAVLAGDEQAFAEIFERYRRVLTRAVSRFFRDRSEIEEFVQQSFTKAYFSLKNFRGGEDHSFAAWVTRIAVNVCYDELRRRQHRRESTFTDMVDTGRDYLANISDNGQPSAESSLAASELAEKILSALDARDRVALTLVYSEEYSLTEAADIIGISASNLKSRLFRCRNQIRSRFGHLFT